MSSKKHCTYHPAIIAESPVSRLPMEVFGRTPAISEQGSAAAEARAAIHPLAKKRALQETGIGCSRRGGPSGSGLSLAPGGNG